MPTANDTLCACGCQELCTPGRKWKHGHWAKKTTLALSPSLITRFWKKVNKTDICWLWIAGGADGYGLFYVDHRTLSAHRVAYELTYGPIPEDQWVLHHCDVRACVRPDHLFLGTAQDNTLDMVQKNGHWTQREPEKMRQLRLQHFQEHPETRPQGEKHPGAKLTAQDIRDMRQLRHEGRFLKDIAQQFGVSPSHVSLIIRRKTWKHLDE